MWTSGGFLDTAPQGPETPHTSRVLDTLRIDCLIHPLYTSIQPHSSGHDTLAYPALLQDLPLLSPQSWLPSPTGVSETLPIQAPVSLPWS